MVVGEIPEAADLVVVGGGPGGYSAALAAAALGRSVTVVDRGGDARLGGVCVNVGCIPSKALIELADVCDRSRRLQGAGLTFETVSVDLAAWQRSRTEMVSALNVGIRGLLRQAGVHVVAGEAALNRRNQLAIRPVDRPDEPSRFIQFNDLIVATGSRPAPVPNVPHDGERVLDSSDALALDHVPASIAVVGGGYIGIELGTAFAKLGARVTIIEAGDQLLGGFDAQVAGVIRRRLDEIGVTVYLGAQVEGVDDRFIRVQSADGERRVEAARIVCAVGRLPNTEGLGLDSAGITPASNGLLTVDADRRLTEHIAAIGDVTPGPALAHKAIAEAAVAAAAVSGRRVAFDPAAIPLVVFSDPEVAVAGMSTDAAARAGLDVSTAIVPTSASGRAATLGARSGFTRLVYTDDGRQVVGAQIVGPHASELIGEAALAIEMGATVEDLALTIHPHPTLSEQLNAAAQLARERS